MSGTTDGLAAIRLQVMWTRLVALVEEQAQTLLRTAFSPIVRESGDISAGLFDLRGRMLAQALTGTPGHINTMARAVGNFLDDIPATAMAEGDAYVTNDPWKGTGHLNDFTVVTPAFHRGRIVALFACTAHMTDVGGVGLSPDGTDLYMEGVLIPVMKLVDSGTLNRTLIAILKANSRRAGELEGDLHAQLASNDAACRRLGSLLDEMDASDLSAVADHIIETSRQAVIDKLRALPKGEARYCMVTDGYEASIALAATLRIEADRVVVDWTGTSAASRFGINVPPNYCAAYTCYALGCAIAPDVPNNHGSLSIYEVTAPAGSILNARPPMPVSCRHVVGLLLPDVVFGCLDQIVPSRVPAESCSAHWALTVRGETGDDPFIVTVIATGGCGGRPGLDGLSATSFPSAVRATPVEIVEASTPLVFWRRELRCGSGGDGAARGGLGQDIEVASRNGRAFTIHAAFDRIDHPARGRAGGGPGAPGALRLRSGRVFPGKGAHLVPAGDRLIALTPGGGGFGPAAERPEPARADDVAAGYVPAAGERTLG